MKTYRVTDECIACHACVEVAESNFEMGDSIAYLKKQPENEKEEKNCENALNVCPVSAIESEEAEVVEIKKKAILAKDNVKEILDLYPQLKDVLIDFSDKFKKILNPVMYQTLARFATFNDAAKISNVSICEILHILNKAIGTEKHLHSIAPECIKAQENTNILSYSQKITWAETDERFIYNKDSMPDLIKRIWNLKPQNNIVLISVEEPVELIKTVAGLGFEQNIEKSREYRISIFNPEKEVQQIWQEKKDSFEQLDVRTMKTDPFDIIIQKAYSTPENDGFVLIQRKRNLGLFLQNTC